MIVHGRKDNIIPISYGKKLFAAATSDRTFYEVKDAGHNNLYQFDIADNVMRFLQKHMQN
jgi:fermentation-respiration switch protein FrsA (DUF1100 family)